MEEAIVNVVRQHHTGGGSVMTTPHELCEWIREAYPHLEPHPDDVAQLVRTMAQEGSITIKYAEGGLGVLELRAP